MAHPVSFPSLVTALGLKPQVISFHLALSAETGQPPFHRGPVDAKTIAGYINSFTQAGLLTTAGAQLLKAAYGDAWDASLYQPGQTTWNVWSLANAIVKKFERGGPIFAEACGGQCDEFDKTKPDGQLDPGEWQRDAEGTTYTLFREPSASAETYSPFCP